MTDELQDMIVDLAKKVGKSRKKGLLGGLLALSDQTLLFKNIDELKKAIKQGDKKAILLRYGKFAYLLYSLISSYPDLKEDTERVLEKLTELTLLALS